MPNDVEKLKKQIKALTTKVPKSTDPYYLKRRLEDLKARKSAGEDVRHSAEDHAVISVSMPRPAKEAVDSIMSAEELGASPLVRKALALWARTNGYAAEAAAIGDE